MRWAYTALFPLLTACITPAPAPTAQTPPPDSGTDSTSTATGATGGEGYLAAVSATSSHAESTLIYDRLYAVVDRTLRKRAEAAGELSEYLRDVEESGNIRLIDDSDDEIECDRTKCLIKLAAAAITAKGSDDPARLAQTLTTTLDEMKVIPKTSGAGATLERRYEVGGKAGQTIQCVQQGHGKEAAYQCRFDLGAMAGTLREQTAARSADHGRLVDCALSPGTSRAARDGAGEIADGVQLPLHARGKTVGWLLGAPRGADAELFGLWICGDVSHDAFVMDGPARQACGWLPGGAKATKGGTVDLKDIHQDEGRMLATATLTGETSEHWHLDVVFQIVADPPEAAEARGSDRFAVKLPKSWCRK